MTRVLTVALFAVLSAQPGCRAKDGENALPPPTGSALGAPSVPELSDIVPGGSRGPDAKAADGDLVGTGTLQAAAEAQLGPKSTGVIAAIHVEEGDKVKKGQVLFRLDSSQASLAAEQAKAGVQAAQVNLQAAELDFKRTEELFNRGSVAPATFDQVKARYEAAKAGRDQANAALSMAQKAGADTVVQSPINGVVSAKLKNTGELATMMPPTVVLIVQDVSSLELRARLPELAPGKAVRASFPALGTMREVTIKRISPGVDPRTRTIEIVATLDNADGKLKPGMLAEVHVPTGASFSHGVQSAARDGSQGRREN